MTTPFEAVVLRYVPDAGSGELLNVGVAMRALDGSFFDVGFIQSWTRITAAFPNTNAPTLRAVFKQIGDVLRKRHVESRLPFSEPGLVNDLRQIVPDPDGAIRWGDTIEGVSSDAERTFAGLMARYVEQHDKELPGRVSRTDAEVGDKLLRALAKRGNLEVRLSSHQLRSPSHKRIEAKFEHCWKNGVWNCLQPISLDLQDPRTIQEKASTWIGQVKVLDPAAQGARVVLFVGLPSPSRTDAHEAAVDALAALEEQVSGADASVFREEEADQLAEQVAADLH